MKTLFDDCCAASGVVLPPTVLEFLGAVFLHSLWLAAAVAGGLAALLACLPRTSASAVRVRYLACVVALVAVPLVAVMAAASPPAAAAWAAGRLRGSGIIVHQLAPWLAPCGLAWAMGIGIGMLRMAVGWSLAYRLVAAATHDERLERQVDRWRAVLGICGRVRVRVSGAVAVPVLVGVARPVIVWPAATFTGFAPDQIEAILVHELAHVRRHDPVVNLLQAVIETTFFHHPAVWWISAQVRGEREHCADELAVTVLGQSNAEARLRYATALVMLEERQRGRPAFAIASDGGCLVARIRRLACASDRRQRGPRVVVAAAVAFLAAAFGLTAGVADRGASALPAAQDSQKNDATALFTSAAAASPLVSDAAMARSALRHDAPEREPVVRRVPAAAAALGWPGLITDDLQARATTLLAAMPRPSPAVVRLTRLTSLWADVAAVVNSLRTDELALGSSGSVTVQEVRARAQQRWRRVSIGSVTTLCPEMADAIAGLSCVEIALPDIQTLAPATAAALARFQGRQISLDGLQAIHAETVSAFAAYAGTLHLPSVTAIDAATAEAIAGLTCAVSLPNLQHASPAIHGPQSGRLPVMIPVGRVFRRPSPPALSLLPVAHGSGSEPGS